MTAQRVTDGMWAWAGAHLAGPLAAVAATVLALLVVLVGVALVTDRWSRLWMEAEGARREAMRTSREAEFPGRSRLPRGAVER
jgi:hypothetical protein